MVYFEFSIIIKKCKTSRVIVKYLIIATIDWGALIVHPSLKKMKNIIILGSTGSIGTQTLDVISKWVSDINIVGLTCGTNIKILAAQIKEFKPRIVSVGSEELVNNLKKELDILGVKKYPEILFGKKGLVEVATQKNINLMIAALVGACGLEPVMAAINAGTDIGLANKEVLVCAGELVMRAVKENKVNIYPIDSEHSAIWQCLNGEKNNAIRKIIITCSGGSFYGKSKKDLEQVAVQEALNHPNWDMGGKITIDSASLMNKGLEVIEARWLFDIPLDKIEVVIHRESIIHSMVEFVDGSMMAQLGQHDMRIPIQYALTYPERVKNNIPSLDFVKLKQLTFNKPDIETFPNLDYAFQALKIGGTMPCAINAANEVAVQAFLDNKIKFLDISSAIKNVLMNHESILDYTLEDIYQVDKETRGLTRDFLKL